MAVPGIFEILFIALIGLGMLLLVGGIVFVAVRSGKSSGGPHTSTCADCGGLVSQRINACPHCGAPLKSNF